MARTGHFLGRHFLELWDMVRCPACPGMPTSDPLTDVAAGRYAIAVDGVHGPLARPAAPQAGSIEGVWFRGTSWHITGGSGACSTGQHHWMLDGAVKAGAIVGAGRRYGASSPSQLDALAESARPIPRRTVPAEALVPAGERAALAVAAS